MWSLIGVVSLNALLINAQILGGWNKADTNSEKATEIVEFAQDEISLQKNSMFASKFESIESVFTQVVAGLNYRVSFMSGETKCLKSEDLDLSKCDTVPGTSERCQANVFVDLRGEKHLSSFHCEPELMLSKRAGGISEEKENPEDYTDLALRALAMSNAAMVGVKVLSAQTQTVAGTNFYLRIQGSQLDGVNQICDLTIWSRPWIQTEEGFKVTKFECNKVVKRAFGMAGGINEQKITSVHKDIALQAIAMSNAALDAQTVTLTRVRTQVVSGMKYYIDFNAQQIGEKPEDKTCEMEVWSRPWVGDGFKVLRLDCI